MEIKSRFPNEGLAQHSQKNPVRFRSLANWPSTVLSDNGEMIPGAMFPYSARRSHPDPVDSHRAIKNKKPCPS